MPLITILILALVVWFCFWLIDQVPTPEPISFIKWVLKAIIAILAIIKVLALVGIALH